MRRLCRNALLLGGMFASLLAVGCGGAQPATSGETQAQPGTGEQQAAASHAFRGRVEEVDPAAKTLKVMNENIEGWMAPMSMVYSADDDEVYAKVKAGDLITATVFDRNYKTLYGVQVIGEDKP